jgi:hypothetical protein
MTALRRFLAMIAVTTLVLIGSSVVRADVINLGTGLSLNWTSSSDFLTIPLTNSAPSGTQILAGWDLKLQIVPQAGATGTLSFNNSNTGIKYPANNVLADPSPNVARNPSSGSVTQIQLDGVDDSGNNVVPASGTNLVALSFNSAGASGDFTLQAVQNGGSTDWTDSLANGTAYGNAGNGATIVLGTIHVPSAAPEPASLMLGALSALGVAGYRWRRKQTTSGTRELI